METFPQTRSMHLIKRLQADRHKSVRTEGEYGHTHMPLQVKRAVCLIRKEDFSSFLLTEVEVQEKYVDVPTTLYQEKVVEVPRVQVAEVVKQVPKIDTWK